MADGKKSRKATAQEEPQAPAPRELPPQPKIPEPPNPKDWPRTGTLPSEWPVTMKAFNTCPACGSYRSTLLKTTHHTGNRIEYRKCRACQRGFRVEWPEVMGARIVDRTRES